MNDFIVLKCSLDYMLVRDEQLNRLFQEQNIYLIKDMQYEQIIFVCGKTCFIIIVVNKKILQQSEFMSIKAPIHSFQIQGKIRFDKMSQPIPKKKLYRQQIQVSRRISQSNIFYFLIIISDISNVISQILFITTLNKNLYYPILFYSTFGQIIIWILNSILLTQLKLLPFIKFYTSLDLLIVLTALSAYTFIQLNLNQISQHNKYIIPALVMHTFSLFFLVGNFRTTIYQVDWSRLKVIFFKIMRIIMVVSFMYYGIRQTKSTQKNDLLLLWITMTVGMQVEMVVRISKIDATDRPYKQMYNLDDTNYE